MVSHPETGSDSPIGSDRESGRDKEEEERYGTRILYVNHVFVWIHDFEYGSVCMDISGSISRV